MITRREGLRLAGLTLAGTLAPRTLAAAPELIVATLSPQNLATPLSALDRLITPTPIFFVRSHFGPPALKRDRRLRVSGMVARPLDLGVADLRRFPEVTVTAVLQCAGNGRSLQQPRVPGVQWGQGAMGQATWTGVRLRDVLESAGVAPGASHLQVSGADRPPKPTVPRFVRSTPLSRALDPGTLIAYRMNGEPLTLAHGAPLRLVVPGWAGDHWVKWLTELVVQERETGGFFMQTAYRFPVKPGAPGAPVPPEEMRPVTTFPIKSVIARPEDGSRLPRGAQTISGVAFSGEAAIARVEVDVDGQGFEPAELEGAPGVGRWQVFRRRVAVTRPGRHEAVVRAIDEHGKVQPEKATWNPSGYFWNGWHRVSWEVA